MEAPTTPPAGERPQLTPRDVPTFPNRAFAAVNPPPPSQVYVGVSAGLAAGAALALLECVAAGIRGELDHVTTGLFAWIVVLDLTLTATIGFVAGLGASALDDGMGPLSRFRRFAEAGADAPQVRVAAIAIGGSIFIHLSILWGGWVAGRFHNALLAALLYLAGQAVLAIPAIAAARLTERRLSFRHPLLPAAAVFLATAVLGATLAPHLDLLELAGLPLVVIVTLIAADTAGRARHSPADEQRRTQLIILGAMATAGLPVTLVALPAPLATALQQTTFIAGWLAAL